MEPDNKSITREQASLICDRITGIVEVIIHRLGKAGVEAGAVMCVTVGGSHEKDCRTAIENCVVTTGGIQSVATAGKTLTTRRALLDRLNNLQIKAGILHGAQHMEAMFDEAFIRPAVITDEELIPLLSSIILPEETAEMDAIRPTNRMEEDDEETSETEGGHDVRAN